MKRSPVVFLLIAFAVLAADQATKYYIRTQVGPFDVIRVLPFFNIVYAENTGSAFGMFKSMGSYFFIAVSVTAIIALSVIILRDRANSLAYSLLIGGAAGNLLDRLIYGYVTDFLDVHAGSVHWPAFNVADSALTAGIALLFYTAICGNPRR